MRNEDTRMSPTLKCCITGMSEIFKKLMMSKNDKLSESKLLSTYDVSIFISANKTKKIHDELSVERLKDRAFWSLLDKKMGILRLAYRLNSIAEKQPQPLEFVMRAIPLISDQLSSILEPEGVKNLNVSRASKTSKPVAIDAHPVIYKMRGLYKFMMNLETELGQDNFEEIGDTSTMMQLVAKGYIEVIERHSGRVTVDIHFM